MLDGLDFFSVYIMGSIEMLTGFHFFIRFLQRKGTVIDYILFAALGMVVMTIFSFSSIWKFLIYILLLMAGGFYKAKTCSLRTALYAVVTIEIMNLCYGISQSLSCVLSPIFFTENPELVSFMFMTVGNILAIIAAVFCYKLVYRCLVYDKAVGDKYILMILAPALLILLVGVYISSNIYGDTITIEADGKLLNVNPYQMLLIETVGIISLFCILYAYQKLIKSFQVSREIALLEQEAHSLSQYVEEAKIRYENTKSFRHDVKNHITIVKELIRNENIEAALQYMGDMENLAAEMSFPVNTNNPVLDILIGNKFGIAKSNRIEVQCSLILPYSYGINDIDFCIIFSNALDNAITACNRMYDNAQKYIHIAGDMQGDFLLIEIENSYSGTESIHIGTGLANIKTVAEKYHGAMEIRTEGKKFILSVLVIIPQHLGDTSHQAD